MPLLDQHPGVVDRLGKPQLEHLGGGVIRGGGAAWRWWGLGVVVVVRWEWHLGLEPPLQEVLDLEAEHVIQLHPVVGEHAGPHLVGVEVLNQHS